MSRKPSTRVTEVTELRRGEEPERSLGERIRVFRKHLGMSRLELAEVLEIAETSIGRYENNEIAPKSEIFNRMTTLAKQRGGFQKLVGTSERELMIFRLQFEMPPEGVAMLLDFAVTTQDDFGVVLPKIVGLGATIINFVTLGNDPSKPKTEALLLLQTPNWETTQAVNIFLRTSDYIKDPHTHISVKGQIEIPLNSESRVR